MNENLQSSYGSLREELDNLKSKFEMNETSFNEELKSLEKKMKLKMKSLDAKYTLLISNHDEKLISHEKSIAESEIRLKNIVVLESNIIEYISFKTIKDWISPSKNYSFNMIYRASKDGILESSFRSACDGKGPTIIVIKTTEDCVFGGYNSQSWNSDGVHYGDDKCFIFTLVNKHGIKPTKYLPDPSNKFYVYGSSSKGFYFGSRDINLSGGQLATQYSTQSFPDAYIDTTGKGKSTLTPSNEFIIQDYEVYQCLVD
ncbi:hypothetical protein CYY_002984 [Polysphondylium violaceum]|uniref:TLDc domain-containing protein n=1 Tax=Polysphondylium violaceum TaxID=133409 RepID=A0A8J4PXQ4_9MYCE|nr:hypothetical protein CYY_002984 [Polysphondylium violaceum]